MELRNRKRLRYDHSTYIPSIVDDNNNDSFEKLDNNVYLAVGVYIFFFGIISFAVMTCNMKYINKPFTQPIMVVPNIKQPLVVPNIKQPIMVVPNIKQPIVVPNIKQPLVVPNISDTVINVSTYSIKNSTQPVQPVQPVQKQQLPEVKTSIYSVFIQTSNHSSSYELYWNRHNILKELIHNANNTKQLDWVHMTLKKNNSNFNSCFVRMNEYSQSNIFSTNTHNLIATNIFLSTNRPTEFIDITIVSGNKKINASQSIITIYDSCV